jgi:RNase P protein component
VREYLRHHLEELPSGCSVIVARPSAAAVGHQQVDRDLARLLGKLRGT